MFSPGDIVRIKENFWEIKPPTSPGHNTSMRSYANQEFEITDNFNKQAYLYVLKDNDWVWHEDWLESVQDNVPVFSENEFLEVFK